MTRVEIENQLMNEIHYLPIDVMADIEQRFAESVIIPSVHEGGYQRVCISVQKL